MISFVRLPDAALRKTRTSVQAAIPHFTPLQRYALSNRIKELARDGVIPARRLRSLFSSATTGADAAVLRLGSAMRRNAWSALAPRPKMPVLAVTQFDPRFDAAPVRHDLADMAKALYRRGCLDFDLSRLRALTGEAMTRALSDAFDRDQLNQARQLLDSCSLRVGTLTTDSLHWEINSIGACALNDPERESDPRGSLSGLVMFPRSGTLGATDSRIDLSRSWAMTLSAALARFSVPFFAIGAPHEFDSCSFWDYTFMETVMAYSGSCAIADDGSVMLDPDLLEHLELEFGLDARDFDGEVGERVREQVRYIKSVATTPAPFTSDHEAVAALRDAASQISGANGLVLRSVASMLERFGSLRDTLAGDATFAAEPLNEESPLFGIHLLPSSCYGFHSDLLEEIHEHMMGTGSDAGVVVRSENADSLAGLASLQGGCIAALSTLLANLSQESA